jgi:Ca-activated chloride channel family protein
MTTSDFEFQYPWVLTLLALLPLYAFLLGRVGRMSALRFPSADLARAAGSVARSAAGRLLVFLRLLAVALCIVALAGPRFANDRTETEASGIDIMLVMDLSWSMMALDMGGPEEMVTRFDIAAEVLEDFIHKRPEDRIGLIVFSAVPYLASPLTLNHNWLVENLRRLHVGMLRDLGTAIGDATAAAAKRLKNLKDSKSRIMIVLIPFRPLNWPRHSEPKSTPSASVLSSPRRCRCSARALENSSWTPMANRVLA